MITIESNNKNSLISDDNHPEIAVRGATKIAILPAELIIETFKYIDSNHQLFVCMQICKDWYSALIEGNVGFEKLWKRNCLKSRYSVSRYGHQYSRPPEGLTWKQHYENNEKVASENVYLHVLDKLDEDLSHYIYRIARVFFIWFSINIGNVLALGSYYYAYKYFASKYMPYSEAVMSTLYFQPAIIPLSYFFSRLIEPLISPQQQQRPVFFKTQRWHDICRHLKMDTIDKIESVILVIEDLKKKQKTFSEKSSCAIL